MGDRLSAWRSVAASVAGAGHRTRQIGCEDASAIRVWSGHEGQILLVAVADGAGSAARADEGSSLAVGAAVAALEADPELCLVDGLRAARAALEPNAAELADGIVASDRATTLLVVRIAGGVVTTAQVGDGAVVLRRCGDLEVLCADERGEYLNETSFLTSNDWESRIRVGEVSARGVDALAAMTDGLQLVAFDLATGRPHVPFFSPFFSFTAAEGSADELAAFLSSERVAGRTDDDVTLAVAVLVAG